MSKPLVLVLQLVALVMIVSGATSEPMNLGIMAVGGLIAVAAGIGIRKRFKQE